MGSLPRRIHLHHPRLTSPPICLPANLKNHSTGAKKKKQDRCNNQDSHKIHCISTQPFFCPVPYIHMHICLKFLSYTTSMTTHKYLFCLLYLRNLLQIYTYPSSYVAGDLQNNALIRELVAVKKQLGMRDEIT